MTPVARKMATMIAVVVLVICLIVPEIGLFAENSRINARTNVIVQQTQTLLTNGKTTSAINSKKTEILAQDIENLIEAYHAQTQQSEAQAVKAASAAKVAAAKGNAELPVLLKQIETAVAAQDAKSINTAVQEATKTVEKYFASKS